MDQLGGRGKEGRKVECVPWSVRRGRKSSEDCVNLILLQSPCSYYALEQFLPFELDLPKTWLPSHYPDLAQGPGRLL